MNKKKNFNDFKFLFIKVIWKYLTFTVKHLEKNDLNAMIYEQFLFQRQNVK